jgi:RNA polymerase sigma factor (sigma-70 family)
VILGLHGVRFRSPVLYTRRATAVDTRQWELKRMIADDRTTQLVRRAWSGEAPAFEELAERLQPLFLLEARRLAASGALVGDPAEAVQETWLVLMRRRHDILPESGRTGRRLLAFGAATLQYIARAQRHKRAVRREVRLPGDSTSQPGPSLPAPACTVELRQRVAERTERLERTIRELSERDQHVVRLRIFEGYDNAGVASELGLAPDTASKVYQRALQRLRAVCPESLVDELSD